MDFVLFGEFDEKENEYFDSISNITGNWIKVTIAWNSAENVSHSKQWRIFYGSFNRKVYSFLNILNISLSPSRLKSASGVASFLASAATRFARNFMTLVWKQLF